MYPGQPFFVSTLTEAGTPITLAAGGTTPITRTLPTDRCVEVYAISGRGTGTFQLKLSDSSDEKGWMDRSIPDAAIVGTAQRPYGLPGRGRYLFRPNGFVKFEFQDTSGAPNDVAVMLWGISRPVDAHRRMLDERGAQGRPFWLGRQQAMAASAVNQVFNLGPAGERMLVNHLLGDAVGAAAGFQAQLFTDATEQRITSQPVDSEVLFGTAQFHRTLPSPIILGPNTRLVALCNDDGAGVTPFIVAGGWLGGDE